MRSSSAIVSALLLTACGSYHPVNYSGPTTASGPAALQCVREEFDDLGYTVTASEPSGTSVTGVRIITQPWYKRVLGFRDSANQITGAISQGRMQVTAVSTDPANPSEGGRAGSGLGANEGAARDARQIIGACTAGG